MKRIAALILTICCCAAASCGRPSAVQSTEIARERPYCENMSEEDFTTVTNDLVYYVSEISTIFSKMSLLCEKYADNINSSDVFEWSQYWDFRETKEKAIAICDIIITYDDSMCSREYQLCIDELKSMAYQIDFFFNVVSQEMDVGLLNTLTQNLSSVIDTGMSNAIIYQTMATISYMEGNNTDTSELRRQIEETYIYRATVHNEKEIKFTNSYGTAKTKCNHKNCSNLIAMSGDTNCCIMHSNKCNNCGIYIDEDAIFCMECLSGKINSLENTPKQSTGMQSNRCQYTDFYGVVCNKSTNKYARLCDAHFNELHNTYCDLINNYYDFNA